jgi:hypothetical protein
VTKPVSKQPSLRSSQTTRTRPANRSVSPSPASCNRAAVNKPQPDTRKRGQCTRCLRVISLTAAGLLHCHGPRCPGSNQPPMSRSVSSVPPLRQKHVTRSSIRAASDFSGVTSYSSSIQSCTGIMELLRHHRCRVLKRVPKASRLPAAEKLAKALCQLLLIRAVLRNGCIF